MVINGGSRSGSAKYAAWLGAHLDRTDTNERVFLRSLDGVTADDLGEALAELSAMASGARSKRGLYHANIDWRHDEHLTPKQKARAVDRLGDELGFTGQPRIVVEHTKEGREHLHVVWLRIDPETGKAIPDSHNFRRHEIVARDLEREFGLERVQGVHIERDGIERPQRTPEVHEFAQAARSGITPAEAKAELRAMWQGADTGQAFAAALDDAGWSLARGDRRDVLVALDPAGETHPINKRLTGLTAAEVRARLADLDAATLPDVDEARQAIRNRVPGAAEPQPAPEPEIGGAEIAAPSPEATQRPSYEATPEPPPDLDARFGPGPEIDPEAEMVIDHAPEPASPAAPTPPAAEPPFVRARDLADEPEAVRWQEPAPGPRPSAADPQPVLVPEPERQDPAPEPQSPDPGRLARAIAAARERLADLAHRLDVAFGRIRDQVLRPEPRPTPEPLKPAAPPTPEVKAMDDNAALILETMRQQKPEPTRPRSVAEQLLQRGRQHREQHPEPERDREQEFGPRRRRMPWEPSL